MTKTAKQIAGDIIDLLEDSALCASVSGAVYRGNRGKSYRPANSAKEDIIVYFTTGDPSQMQSGIIAINIYVPDIEHNGGYLENGKRCEEVEVLAQRWVASLTAARSDYRFTLMQTIYTEEEAAINQHFVAIKLKYNLLTA